MEKLASELKELKDKIALGGGQDRIDKQHKGGKMSARERIEYLLDPGTFQELDVFTATRCNDFGMDKKRIPGDGVVTGFGRVEGRLVYLFAQDFTVLGGSLGEMHGQKICKIMDLAVENGAPVIALNDSGGARIQEGVLSLKGYGDIFYRNTISSGVVPQIAAIMGPCAGGAVYSPGIMDFIFMVENTSHMFITGPEVIKTVTNEDVSFDDLGSADIHMAKSGVAHFSSANDQECLDRIRELLSFIPSNNLESPPYFQTNDDPNRMDRALYDIVPVNPNKPYDVRDVISQIVDDSSFLEIHEKWATNMVVGFARFDGMSVGIVANQPLVNAGTIDIDASAKAARFVRFCDCFNIPLVTLVDTPGFLPGTDQEYGGIIRHGAKLLYAYSEATVPKVTVTLRKAYGGAYIVMCSKHLGADVNFAWPCAEIAVMGPQGAVNIVFRKEITEAEDKQKRRDELINDYKVKFANPKLPASYGYIDDVIDPVETRPRIINALHSLVGKSKKVLAKKHGNIPL